MKPEKPMLIGIQRLPRNQTEIRDILLVLSSPRRGPLASPMRLETHFAQIALLLDALNKPVVTDPEHCAQHTIAGGYTCRFTESKSRSPALCTTVQGER
jgi:hypothetical protein